MAAAALLLAGCAATRGPEPGLGPWTSATGQDHPLVGVVWDAARSRRATWQQLVARAARADVVLLGEQHDNADHHRLQAALLRDLLAGGRRPAVAFEQLDLEQQARVDASRQPQGAVALSRDEARQVAARLAGAVEWKRSGWPPFGEYLPIFEAALEAGLPIRAANLSRRSLAASPVARGGAGAPLSSPAASGGAAAPTSLPDPGVAAASTLPVLPPRQHDLLRAEVVESHCGYAPEAMVTMMQQAQLRRDAAMAAAASASAPTVLICGFGHARRDRGVPLHLAASRPGLRVLSVAFVEVVEGLGMPADYAAPLHADGLPFDFVVFTPRVDDEDPCTKFRAKLEAMKAGPR